MKKTFILLSVSFLLVSLTYLPCKAQETKQMRFGIKGGLNIANLYTSDAKSSDMLIGFNVGVFDKMPVSNFFTIQPELYITTKGATVNYNNLLINGSAKFNLTYIELPILFVANVNELFNVQFGPYVAYLVDGTVKNQSNLGIFDFEKNINIDNYNRIDAGVVVGAGLDFGAISLGARFNLGLTKVGKTQTILGTSYTVPNATNGVINFYLAIALN